MINIFLLKGEDMTVTSKQDSPIKKMNFEESLQELENIVRSLESGNVGLDESLKKFEEGIKLYKSCRLTLDKAEKKIKVLNDSLKEVEYEGGAQNE